jgi:hypothetical protein
VSFTYPDVRENVWRLVQTEQFAGEQGTPYFQMTPDFADELPAVQIILLTGVEGFLDRTDRVQIDVYAEGEKAAKYAEAVKQRFVGANVTIDPELGLLDVIVAEVVPHDVPYPSDRINVSSAVYRVTTRPMS